MHHGIRLEDPYHWLQDRDDPEVLAHLWAENAYTHAVMDQSGGLPERLYQELLGRIEENNESAAFGKGAFLYKSRISQGQNYREYMRKPLSGGDWKVYFDANAEAGHQDYFDLGFLDVDPEGKLLAYAVDLTGDEEYTLKFRDLESGEDLPQCLEKVSPDGEWSADGGFYYFLRETESRRPYQIYRYRIGSTNAIPQLVYEDIDEQFFVGIYKSQDAEYLFAYSESNETTEVSWLDADDTNSGFQVFQHRRHKIQYWLEHQDANWLIRTNEKAPDFRLLMLPVRCSEVQAAVELEAARPGVRLTEVLPLRKHRILFETRNGLDHVRIQHLESGMEHEVAFPDPVYEIHPVNNEEYDVGFLQFTYSSPIRPTFTFSYDLDSREREILKETQVPSGHEPDQYSTQRLMVPDGNGVQVPLTLAHHKDLSLDGTAPVYLYAYGAYGSPESMAFNPLWLTWLERGFVVAIAHVRGGGLLGESWYQAGKLQHKQNSFDDFIACARFLLDNKYTCREKLAIEGGSAGGLLIGAVLNSEPELFKAAVAAVPFVDVVNTMLDPSLPLTTHEYEEWGNPAEKDAFLNMLKWSPCDNVSNISYPALLATAGLNDPRVPFWEAAKWVARLRQSTTSSAPILLRTDMGSGHAGPSGRYPFLRETAFEQAFLLEQLKES
jgi:oligopeptidase B